MRTLIKKLRNRVALTISLLVLALSCAHPTPPAQVLTKTAAAIDLAACIAASVPVVSEALKAPDWESKLSALAKSAPQAVLCALKDIAVLATQAEPPPALDCCRQCADLARRDPAGRDLKGLLCGQYKDVVGACRETTVGQCQQAVESHGKRELGQVLRDRASACEGKPAAECRPEHRAALYLIRRARYVGDVQIR